MNAKIRKKLAQDKRRIERRVVYRLLGWNRWLEVFFRLVDQSHRPLRC